MTTVLIFSSSLFLMFLLVVLKAFEIKFDRKNIFLKYISRLDQRLISSGSSLKFRLLQVVQSVRYLILIEASSFFSKILSDFRDKMLNEYTLRQNLIMGKRDIVSRGSVSFYLRKIKEDKDRSERGRIEF